MKTFRLFALCLATPMALISQETSNTYPVTVAATAREFFVMIRSNVAGHIEAKLGNQFIQERDVESMIGFLVAESNKLRSAAYDQRLSQAVKRIEAVQAEIVAVLKNPENKKMALALPPDDFLRELTWQQALGAVLTSDLNRLRTTIDELARWATLMRGVAPPDQVSERLKVRLKELLGEWRQEMEPSKSSNDPSRTEASKPSSSVPLATVIRMAEAGASEDEIISFIAKSTESFAVDADAIVSVHGRLSSKVICRMIERDAALRWAGSGRATNTPLRYSQKATKVQLK